MEQLSALDAAFLYFETKNAPMHIGSVAIYDQSTVPGGVLAFKEILRNYESRLHLARAFRQRLAYVPGNLDHPYWFEDPDFDIEFHVRHIALPHPGDWRQLCIQVARLHSRALDTNRPLWEFYVLEGLDNVEGIPKGSFAIVSKVHHAAIDGVSGAEMTAAVHDLTPDAKPQPPEEQWVPEREPLALELLARSAGHTAVQPFRLANVLARSVPALARAGLKMTTGELKSSGPVPRTRFNACVSPHRVFDGRSFALDDLKFIRTTVPGATVNDVVLTVCGGALRKYLEDKEELPTDSMVAMTPISVRAAAAQKSAGNQVSAMTVAIGTDIADPMERLEAVFAHTTSSKELTNAVGAKNMTDYTQFIPSMTAGLAARLYSGLSLANRMKLPMNCVITNVPGPNVPLYMTGARLVTQFGLGPILDGMGLIMPVFSYGGQITISISSCREMVPDPAYFAQCIQESFDELLAAAQTRAASPKFKKMIKAAAGKKRASLSRDAVPAHQSDATLSARGTGDTQTTKRKAASKTKTKTRAKAKSAAKKTTAKRKTAAKKTSTRKTAAKKAAPETTAAETKSDDTKVVTLQAAE
ncbi:wax ester/triacylglycerol synthase family O-acyltransferase [Pyruvatibacter mobilis]|uniref:WS/DGAT/MGAT family O-acyltransferase n=1 Tax=Pyruvatibacter mobilis TaxID=1712261 RepID=UPI003D104126